MKTAYKILITTLLTIPAFAGTVGGGGGGKYSKMCAEKVYSILNNIQDSKHFDVTEAKSTFENEVKWEVKPALIDVKTYKIYAPRKSKLGDIITDPSTAFYGSKNWIQINSNSDLDNYCDLENHCNDEVILHEVMRGLGKNDEVFQISLQTFKEKPVCQTKRNSIYTNLGIALPTYSAPIFRPVSDGEAEVDLDRLGDGHLILAVNPGPYLGTPAENSYQKRIAQGLGFVMDDKDLPRIGEAAELKAEAICQGVGYQKVSFQAIGWARINNWIDFDKKIQTPEFVGYVQTDGSIHVGSTGEQTWCAQKGFFGECGNGTWEYAYAFFTKIRCRK